MDKIKARTWRHPGKRSSDYALSDSYDHDRRTYAGAQSYAGFGPKNFVRSDKRIIEEVSEILFWDPDVDATDIDISVQNQCLILEGSVDSRHAKKQAEAALENVAGIKDIFNRLTIRSYLDFESDKIITRGDEGLFTQETIRK